MKKISFIAFICMFMMMLTACEKDENACNLKAKSVLIDGKVNKDVVILDDTYVLRVELEDSYHLHTTVTFSLISPLTNYTSRPQLELLNGDNVVATLDFGTDAGDEELVKKFKPYCEGHAQRTFEATFYYNTDNEEEAKQIIQTAKTFRIKNMFK